MSRVAESNENRHGLRRPYAQTSGQLVPGWPAVEHSGPPANGLPGGIEYDVVPGAIRRIFPSSRSVCWAFCSVSSPPPPSPTEM